MKIGIIGASGQAGSFILKEALSRGHEVTAIVRNASKIEDKTIPIIEKSIYDLTADDVKDFEVVVNAFGAPLGEEQPHVAAGNALINAIKGTNTKAIIVGGAGSLYADSTQIIKLMDTNAFSEFFYPTASGQARNLQQLKDTPDITWTFLSPSANFDPEGKRTGTYQVGKDQLLLNSKGESYISYADYAIALVDEIENPKHINERFTVAGEAE